MCVHSCIHARTQLPVPREDDLENVMHDIVMEEFRDNYAGDPNYQHMKKDLAADMTTEPAGANKSLTSERAARKSGGPPNEIMRKPTTADEAAAAEETTRMSEAGNANKANSAPRLDKVVSANKLIQKQMEKGKSGGATEETATAAGNEGKNKADSAGQDRKKGSQARSSRRTGRGRGGRRASSRRRSGNRGRGRGRGRGGSGRGGRGRGKGSQKTQDESEKKKCVIM